jgi:hypothetical protein
VTAAVPVAVAVGVPVATTLVCEVAVAVAVATEVTVAFAVAVEVGALSVALSEGDLLTGPSSPQEAETAALVMTAAPSAYCAARESPAGIATTGRARTSPSQNGQRASVS